MKGAKAQVFLFISCMTYLCCEKRLCYILGSFIYLLIFSQSIYQHVACGSPEFLEQVILLTLLDVLSIKIRPEFSCYFAKTWRHHLICTNCAKLPVVFKKIIKLLLSFFFNFNACFQSSADCIQTSQHNDQVVFDIEEIKQALVVRFWKIKVVGMVWGNY